MSISMVSFSTDPFHGPRLQTGNYAGNNGSRTITLSFVPDFIIVQQEMGGTTTKTYFKGRWNTDWCTALPNAGPVGDGGAVDNLTSSGAGFTVRGNACLTGINYYWFAFKAGG